MYHVTRSDNMVHIVNANDFVITDNGDVVFTTYPEGKLVVAYASGTWTFIEERE